MNEPNKFSRRQVLGGLRAALAAEDASFSTGQIYGTAGGAGQP